MLSSPIIIVVQQHSIDIVVEYFTIHGTIPLEMDIIALKYQRAPAVVNKHLFEDNIPMIIKLEIIIHPILIGRSDRVRDIEISLPEIEVRQKDLLYRGTGLICDHHVIIAGVQIFYGMISIVLRQRIVHGVQEPLNRIVAITAGHINIDTPRVIIKNLINERIF